MNSSGSLKTSTSGGSQAVTPSPSTDTAGASLFSGGSASTPSNALDGGKLEGDKNTIGSSAYSMGSQHAALSATQSSASCSASAISSISGGTNSVPASATMAPSSYTLFGTFSSAEEQAAAQAALAQQKKRERSLSMGTCGLLAFFLHGSVGKSNLPLRCCSCSRIIGFLHGFQACY